MSMRILVGSWMVTLVNWSINWLTCVKLESFLVRRVCNFARMSAKRSSKDLYILMFFAHFVHNSGLHKLVRNSNQSLTKKWSVTWEGVSEVADLTSLKKFGWKVIKLRILKVKKSYMIVLLKNGFTFNKLPLTQPYKLCQLSHCLKPFIQFLVSLLQ